ncbi:MAG: YdcF family protein [Verrucomicrobiae bacterium]|nr:YdcF family protein [Verrucomicrobiae bacterium]
MAETESSGGRFWRRRACWVPTWRTVLLALALVLAASVAVLKGVQPFLAVTELVPADTLVVEGWCEDHVIAAAWSEFQKGGYTRLMVTGGPLDQGAPLSEYGTFAELSAALLQRWAPPGTPIIAVPGPRADRDRTYSNALTLRRWFDAHGGMPGRLNLVTTGAHARRSRLLFAAALGGRTTIGIMAVQDLHYDPGRWWRSSAGVRTVISEFIAYVYAVTLFRPEPIPAGDSW